MKDKYLRAFMDMTSRFALTSSAEKLKVGACLIKNNNPICFGVNGTLPGWHTNKCEDASGNTTEVVLHAEINCLNKLRKINETAVGAILLITHAPCIRCAHEILDSGVVQVYYLENYKTDEGVLWLRQNGVGVLHANLN